MEEFLGLINQYTRTELIVLVPVLYFISKMVASSKINTRAVPLIVMLTSITLSTLYVFSSMTVDSLHTILWAAFGSITQGVLFAGITLYSGILINPKAAVSTLISMGFGTEQSKPSTEQMVPEQSAPEQNK